jgi:phosphatidylinositol-bisphosphatase
MIGSGDHAPAARPIRSSCGRASGAAIRRRFSKIVSKQMVGVYVSVWAREDVARRHIRGVEVASVGCGIMGYLGNKVIRKKIQNLIQQIRRRNPIQTDN